MKLELSDLLTFAWQFGVPGVSLLALIVVIWDPTRAEGVRAFVLAPFFNLFRWGSRQYLASRIGYTTTTFFRTFLAELGSTAKGLKIHIRWVRSPQDPVLKEDGTLILCLAESSDQTRNILTAARVALPTVLLPTLRTGVDSGISTAIDMTVLRRLTLSIGKHAGPVFQRHFYATEVSDNERVADLFSKLVAIDEFGVFVPILLEELHILGESVFSLGDMKDKSAQVEQLLEFLLKLAKRDVGEEVPLALITADIRLAIVLFARTKKAKAMGVTPYVDRVKKALDQGCDSIYLITYDISVSFFKRVLAALQSNERIDISGQYRVRSKPPSHPELSGELEIAVLRRTNIFHASRFDDQIAALNIAVGDILEGTVLDVADNLALIDVGGINASLAKDECSWQFVQRCQDTCEPGDTRRCLVQSIDKDRERLSVSLRLPDTNPLLTSPPPAVGSETDAIITAISDRENILIGSTESKHEIVIPAVELSWKERITPSAFCSVGERWRVKILEVDMETCRIKGSIRQCEPDPWPIIHTRFPRGTQMRAMVRRVLDDAVVVDLPDGFVATIPGDAMRRTGHEFAKFQENVVPGQGITVAISRVFIGRHKIHVVPTRLVNQDEPD